MTGAHIAAERVREAVPDEKNVLELLNEISVAKFDSASASFDITICPVCRGVTADEPVCDFLSGFIEGVLSNLSIRVDETKCKARGDKSCVFTLTRTRHLP